MKSALSSFLIALLLALMLPDANAQPILKPMKYYGPIPKKSFSLRIGFIGGSTSQEMWDKLDALAVERSGVAYTDDFGNCILIDGSYTVKLHPNFAVRTNIGLGLLRSDSWGFFVSTIGEAPHPARNFKREFNVSVISIEGDALYYFSDASVNEFQPYFGGGFSVWVPYASYQEDLVDEWYGPMGEVDSTVVRPGFEKTDWSFEAGIQGVLGALYYLSNSFAVAVESRYHIAQSTFGITIPTPDGNRNVNFIVDYTGFVFSVGILKAF
jgi:hypothetical protein